MTLLNTAICIVALLLSPPLAAQSPSKTQEDVDVPPVTDTRGDSLATMPLVEPVPIAAILQSVSLPITIKGDDGLEALFLEDSSLGIVSLYFVFDAGSVFDPEDKLGLSAVSAATLLEGTSTQNRTQFFRSLQNLGVRLDTGSSRDIIWVSLQTPAENLNQALELFIQMLTLPDASPEAVNRVRQKILSQLAFQQQKLENRAQNLWWESVFDNHPYRHNPLGTSETLNNITSADVKRFIYQHLSRASMRIGIAGALNRDEGRDLLLVLEKSLLKSAPDKTVQSIVVNRAITPAQEAATGTQTAVYFGQRGINRLGKYYYHALVINHVLGGGAFSSRLMQSLREEKGLTYGVDTTLMTGKYSPLLVGSFNVSNDKLKEALRALLETWQTLSSNGITERELVDAKNYLVGSFLINNDSTARIAQTLALMHWQGLAPLEWQQRAEKINALTLDEINQVAKTLINPAQLSVALVGAKTR